MSCFCSRNHLFNRHVSLTTGFWNICFLWPWDSFEECWSGILLNTPQLGSNYFSIHLDCRFWGGDNKGELPFSSYHMNVMYNHYDLFLDQMFTIAHFLPLLCLDQSFVRLLSSPQTPELLVPKPEKTLKWRMCLTYALFLTTWRHNPYQTTNKIIILPCLPQILIERMQ